MTRQELIDYVRVLVDDNVQDYLCSTEKLNEFATEAEREAAERSLLFSLDGSYDIMLKADTATYDVDDFVIFIERAKIQGEAKPLSKTLRRELDFEISDWQSMGSGTPVLYFQEGSKITLYPTPSAAVRLLLDGFRRPEFDMETPAHLHSYLAYWMMYRYYSIKDSDVYSPQLAQESLNKFEMKFGHARDQRFENAWRDGAKHSPMYRHAFTG